MAGIIPTNINAFYSDLAEAKKEEAIAHQKVIELQDTIVARGHQLPNADGSFADPNEDQEDTASSDDVSAAEVKPLTSMNRDELETYATEHGVENPVQYQTKSELLSAINAKESEETS